MSRAFRVLMPMPREQGDWYRRIVQGVAVYLASNPERHWDVQMVEDIDRDTRRIRIWKPDGLIGVVSSHDSDDSWLRLGPPVVSIASTPAVVVPSAAPDEEAIGRLGARHLAEHRPAHLAFFGCTTSPASRQRQAGFLAEAARSSETHVFSAQHAATVLPVGEIQPFERDLTEWLRSLPSRTGVMAWNDLHAVAVVQAARRLGLRVPNDLAVLGVDDDDTWCGLCRPQLSSVRPPFHRVGYEAAAMLDDLMDGRHPRPDHRVVPPEGVSARQSTDMVVVADEVVAEGIDYIRRHLSERLNVDSLARGVGVSRRLLEKRFRSTLDTSPLRQIHLSQQERAEHLLRTTDLPLAQIARRCGFRDANHLSRFFRAQAGLPPGAFRKRYRV